MNKILKRLNKKGDTIIEVIVVLAVLGLALSISYATASHSLTDTTQAQQLSEHSETLKSQLELLITMSSNPQYNSSGSINPDYIFSNPEQDFCIQTDALGIPHITRPVPCNGVTISYIASSSPTVIGGTFRISSQWPDVAGANGLNSGLDSASLTYNLYQPPQ